ncbi:MAG TPA: metallophosphoesterase, partial [Anaerovoracaceae bacterium]|nr:metallophosphoesterase [Anaerovoracaceae bacterium]
MENILHVSDLHVSLNSKNGLHYEKCKMVAQKTADDAKEVIKKTGKPIDTIIFSGDIAFSGKSEEYEKALEFFITPLLDSLGLGLDRLFICPGNHDSDRSTISRFELKYRETSTLQEKNQLAKDIMNSPEPWARAEAFNSFRKVIDKSKSNIIESNNLYSVYRFSEKLSLICLSSSWLAQSNDEEKKLYITESQINTAIKKTPSDSQRILVIHHPLTWLSPEDARQISTVIEKKIDILLFGHMHEFDQSIEAKFSEDITLRLQAGTLDPSEKNPGYSIITLQNQNNIKYGKIIYRKYCHEANNYIDWNERGRKGEFDFSTDGSLTFDSEKFSVLSQKILEQIDKEILINTGLSSTQKKSVRELFISPNLNKLDCLDMFPSVQSIDDFDEIINFKGVAIVSGGSKRGKSFSLQYIFAKKLEKQVDRSFSDIAFHLDARSKEITSKGKITQKLCVEYIDQDLATSFEKKIKQSISDGCATIIIDNFCEAKATEQKTIIDFIHEYKECNYIISISTANAISLIKSLVDKPGITLGATSIGTLKRNNIRQIVSKWAPSIAFDTEDRIFSDVMRVVKNSQLPHNHFIYSMLLTIYENKRELKGILNEADVIENFIEILLRKHFINASPELPQYKELLHFLGYLCHEMTLGEFSSIGRNELLGVALEFNKKTLFSYRVELYIEPLISSGILSSAPPYRFTQTCFLDFGISYYMSHSSEFKDRILNVSDYLNYDKAIEYFASKNSSSLESLNFIKERTFRSVEALRQSLLKDHKIDITDLNLNKVENISFLDIASTSEEFERKIIEIKSDRSRHDEMMDEISPLNSEGRAVENSMTTSHDDQEDSEEDDHDGISLLRENLSLYSRIFRGTELIMNPDETIAFFDDIVSGYVFLIKAIICRLDEDFIIPLILPRFEAEFLADDVSQQEKEDFVANFRAFISVIRSTIPNHIQNLMAENLTSRKPRLHNIINRVVDNNVSDIVTSLLICLLIDIQHGDVKSQIK